MTLREGKDKVYMLLDEYSSGGTVERDADLEARMAPFFDTAQKQLAQLKRIVKTWSVEKVSGVTEYATPADFGQLYRIWEDGEVSGRLFRFFGTALVVPASAGAIKVEYFAIPTTINASTPDTYSFEVDDAAAECMPFFVAAQQLVSDMLVDYSGLLNLWQTMLNALDTRLPEAQRAVRSTYRRRGV